MTAADRPSVTPRVGDTITTAEQLDALPSLAIVIDANDEVQQRHGHLSTERGDYSAWLGVMPPTCKPSPDVALPVTVLYVPGEQPADRPSVTDNARAEAERRWPHGEYRDPLMRGAMREKQRAFVAGAEWAAGRAETTTEHECDSGDFDRTICDCGAMHSYCTSCGTRQDDCPHGTTTATAEDVLDSLPYFTFEDDDVAPDEEFVRKADVARLLAAARTATIEDAEEVLHGAGWFARADLDPRDLRGILRDLADAGLLATARTRPTRDDISDAIEHSGIAIGTSDAEQAADAVLALYADQPTEAEAGARALEDAADEFEAIEQRYAIVHSPVAWLRERADRTRDGAR